MNTNELITKLHSEAIEKQQKINELNDRIDKAIEYINENMYELTARLDETSKFCKNGELDDLLKILKGEE